jgi:hypothetical protein
LTTYVPVCGMLVSVGETGTHVAISDYRALEARLAQCEAEAAILRAWKAEALEVMNGMRLAEVGTEIGVPLGKLIGPEILPFIRRLRELMRVKDEALRIVHQWWVFVEAHREVCDEPRIPDDAVILHFMGSGASTQVTAADFRAMGAALAQTEQSEGGAR